MNLPTKRAPEYDCKAQVYRKGRVTHSYRGKSWDQRWNVGSSLSLRIPRDAAESHKPYPEKREKQLVCETWTLWLDSQTNGRCMWLKCKVRAGLEKALQSHSTREQQETKVDTEVRQTHTKEGEKVFTFIYNTRVKAVQEPWHLSRMQRTNTLLKQAGLSHTLGDTAREQPIWTACGKQIKVQGLKVPLGFRWWNMGFSGWNKNAEHASFQNGGNCACCAEAHLIAIRVLGYQGHPGTTACTDSTRMVCHVWDFSCSATPVLASSLSQGYPAGYFLGHTTCPSPTLLFCYYFENY